MQFNSTNIYWVPSLFGKCKRYTKLIRVPDFKEFSLSGAIPSFLLAFMHILVIVNDFTIFTFCKSASCKNLKMILLFCYIYRVFKSPLLLEGNNIPLTLMLSGIFACILKISLHDVYFLCDIINFLTAFVS